MTAFLVTFAIFIMINLLYNQEIFQKKIVTLCRKTLARFEPLILRQVIFIVYFERKYVAS